MSLYNYRSCKISTLTHGQQNLANTTMRHFKVTDLDGWIKSVSRLSTRPYIIETGSLTCPFFHKNRQAMDEIARRHPEFDFFVLYTREAHPNRDLPAHRSVSDKLARAHDLQSTVDSARRVIFEDLKGETHCWLGALPNSMVVVDHQQIVLHLRWNDPQLLENYLTHYQDREVTIPVRDFPELSNAVSVLARTKWSVKIRYALALSKLYLTSWLKKAGI